MVAIQQLGTEGGKSPVSRREMLARAVGGLAALALGGGCGIWDERFKVQAREWFGENDREIRKAALPFSAANEKVGVDLQSNLIACKEALDLTHLLLCAQRELSSRQGSGRFIQVEHLLYGEFISGRNDTANYANHPLVRSDESESFIRSVVEIRAAIVKRLRETQGVIQRRTPDSGQECGVVEGQLYVNLARRFGLLADRIEAKTQLASENIIDRWHKTGSTSMLIGRTEDLADARQEVAHLIALLNQKAKN